MPMQSFCKKKQSVKNFPAAVKISYFVIIKVQ